MYDGRVKTGKRWWQFWRPEFDASKWRCQHCGTIYRPFLDGSSTFHEFKMCLDRKDRRP